MYDLRDLLSVAPEVKRVIGADCDETSLQTGIQELNRNRESRKRKNIEITRGEFYTSPNDGKLQY